MAASNKHVHSVHHPGLSHSLHHGNQAPGGPGGFEFQRISIDRSKMSEEEAFEHAIEMIQTRQMGFRKAADFFSVRIKFLSSLQCLNQQFSFEKGVQMEVVQDSKEKGNLCRNQKTKSGTGEEDF